MFFVIRTDQTLYPFICCLFQFESISVAVKVLPHWWSSIKLIYETPGRLLMEAELVLRENKSQRARLGPKGAELELRAALLSKRNNFSAWGLTFRDVLVGHIRYTFCGAEPSLSSWYLQCI